MQLTSEMFSSIVASLHGDAEPGDHHERRADPRVGLRAKLKVISCEKGRTSRAIDVSVRDLSRSGICLISPVFMRPGSHFIAHLPGGKSDPLAMLYEVRHCTQIDSALMKIGAHLDRILVNVNAHEAA